MCECQPERRSSLCHAGSLHHGHWRRQGSAHVVTSHLSRKNISRAWFHLVVTFQPEPLVGTCPPWNSFFDFGETATCMVRSCAHLSTPSWNSAWRESMSSPCEYGSSVPVAAWPCVRPSTSRATTRSSHVYAHPVPNPWPSVLKDINVGSSVDIGTTLPPSLRLHQCARDSHLWSRLLVPLDELTQAPADTEADDAAAGQLFRTGSAKHACAPKFFDECAAPMYASAQPLLVLDPPVGRGGGRGDVSRQGHVEHELHQTVGELQFAHSRHAEE